MDTTTLSNALKAVFGTTITSSTSGVANFLAPLFNASGDPAGRIGMSDLASVLGGLYDYESKGNIDRKSLIGNGKYYLYNTCTNLPVNKDCFLYVFRHFKDNSHPYLVQIAFSSDGTSGVWYDVCDYGSWKGWQQLSTNIPLFYKDYSTLSDLAIGLGINGGGIKWTTAYRSTDEGYPFSDWGGVLLLGIERYGIEFCVQYQGNKLYYRMHWQDTVYGWKEITHS